MDIKAKFRDKVSKLLFLEMDKDRLKRATTAARKEAANLTKRANAMNAAAKGGRRK